jgi:DNA-binding XRE family transcriptional regulator
MQLQDEVRSRRELPSPPLRRALREAAGVSAAAVAHEVGVCRQTVTYWERGKRRVGPKHVVAYAAVLRLLAEAGFEVERPDDS